MGRTVFISGGTGYMGASLIPELLSRGHSVQTLCRQGSERKLPGGVDVVFGDALDASKFAVRGCDTLVHLIGTPHPAPWKGEQFRSVDLPSLQASITAAKAGNVSHIVYVSVAHPAPVMKSYIAVRMECEEMLRRSGVRASILRPWYVLGPGHRWPLLLKPAYWFCERLPAVADGARRLGLVTRSQMTAAIVHVVEHPPGGLRVFDVEKIRSAAGRL